MTVAMTKVIEDLKTLKVAIDEQKRERARLEGRLESHLSILTEKYGLTEETALAKVEELTAQEADLQEKINRIYNKLTTEYEF